MQEILVLGDKPTPSSEARRLCDAPTRDPDAGEAGRASSADPTLFGAEPAEPEVAPMPRKATPIASSLRGVLGSGADLDEEDYRRYLEEKYL